MKIPKEHYGILLGLIGFFISLTGGILAFSFLPKGGAYLIILGWIFIVVGGVLHFFINAGQIFGRK